MKNNLFIFAFYFFVCCKTINALNSTLADIPVTSSSQCLEYFKVPTEWSRNLTVSCFFNRVSGHSVQESQTSSFSTRSYFNLYKCPDNPNSDPILVLYQQFDSTPGTLLQNDVKQGIRYFQGAFRIQNTVVSTTNNDISKEGFLDIVYTSPNSIENTIQQSTTVLTEKDFGFGVVSEVSAAFSAEGPSVSAKTSKSFEFGSKTSKYFSETYNIKEWGVTEFTRSQSNEVQNSTSDWVFHQNLPFDFIVDTESNKHAWFQSKAIQTGFQGWYVGSKMNGKTLPTLSTSTLKGSTITVWSIPSSYESMTIKTDYTHSLGNIKFGSHYEGENTYSTKSYVTTQILNISYTIGLLKKTLIFVGFSI